MEEEELRDIILKPALVHACMRDRLMGELV